jgi:hypothetical protein
MCQLLAVWTGGFKACSGQTILFLGPVDSRLVTTLDGERTRWRKDRVLDPFRQSTPKADHHHQDADRRAVRNASKLVTGRVTMSWP